MHSAPRPSRWAIATILTIGILSVSTAAIFIRLALQAADSSGLGVSLVLAAARMSIASLIVAPAWRQGGDRPLEPSAMRYSIAAGLFLAIHFAAWITSLSYTSIAASTALVTTNPVWVALLSWRWFHEIPSRLTIVGIATALVGSIVISLGDGGNSTASLNPLLGNGLALVGSWAVSLYFLLGREAQQRGLPIGRHAVLTYSFAALTLLPLPPLVGASYGGFSPAVYGYVALMALFPQAIGHTSLNWSVRWVSPTLVTLTILAEPVGSAVLGYLVFRENPGGVVLLGALVVLLGVAIAVWGSRVSTRTIPE
ncbi:MAG: DMT family transporter [Kaiparowitsia implicata GSE-PSE-MK54-09C]|nr:DMT family transporter [Kaiparowitsia implicata GSE-PSE-MK54-09C]